MNTIITDEFATLIDGPFYEHSPAAVAAIKPLLPTPEEMHAEFRVHLARNVDGVELAPMAGTRHAVIEIAPGVQEIFRRTKLYGRAQFSGEAVAAGAVDEIRSIALAVARKYAERIAEQAMELRAARGIGLAAVVVRHLGTPIPWLLTRRGDPDALRICVDETTDSFSAIYGAYYAITPTGREVVEAA